MKIYRCFIGVLFVLFIGIAVLFIVSYINERSSDRNGTLIWKDNVIAIEHMGGEGGDVTNHSIC